MICPNCKSIYIDSGGCYDCGTRFKKMRVGDIVAFHLKGGFKILSFILGLFEPQWRKREVKYWHLGIVSEVLDDQFIKVIEAVSGGAKENYYEVDELLSRADTFHWFKKKITKHRIEHFKNIYLGRPYDVGAYIGVIVSYLIRKYLKLNYRVVDNSFMCWELVGEFTRFNEKPFNPNWQYPMIHEIIEKLEKEGIDNG